MGTALQTANTIIDQLNNLDPRALWAWGAKDFVYGKLDGKNEGLKFRVSGSKTKRGSWLMITLNGRDLYDIKLFRHYKGQIKVDNEANDIFAEDLVNVIDEMVG